MVSVCLNQWKFVQGHISWLEWSWNTITVLLSTNQILSRLTKRVELWMVSVTLGNQKGTNGNEQKSFKYKALFWKEGLICFHCPVAGLNTTALNGGHLCETFRNSRSYMWIWGRKTIIMRKFHDKAVPLKETAPRLRPKGYMKCNHFIFKLFKFFTLWSNRNMLIVINPISGTLTSVGLIWWKRENETEQGTTDWDDFHFTQSLVRHQFWGC